MGIPYYFNHIIKSHPEILKKLLVMKKVNNFIVNNLYLDSNSIIYDVVHKIDNPKMKDIDTIIQKVIEKIEYYINEIKPINIVYIAFDGVAPMGKMIQQRERRFKTTFSNTSSTTTNNILINPQETPFDTVYITPGTLFMKNVGDTIRSHFKKNTNVIVSASDEPGEGEHKIFNYIRNTPDHYFGNNVIYGLDADLIMLSMNHLNFTENLFLVREAPHFSHHLSENTQHKLSNNSMKNIHIKVNENDEDLYVVDIQKLSTKLPLCFSNYVFICFFLGNDFLPHFPAINIRTGGVDKIVNTYSFLFEKKQGKNIIEKDCIKWKNVFTFVSTLAEKEEEYIVEEYNLRNKKEKMQRNITIENIPTFEREVEKYINPCKLGWQERYYKTLFGIQNVTENKKKQICVNYLEMLEWCFKYYKGECPNWEMSYKYHYPPLLEDLRKHIPIFDKDLVPLQVAKPVLPIVQLIYVLPKKHLFILPTEVREKILPLFCNHNDENTEIIWAFCKYFWECHVNLPDISIKDIENIIMKKY